MWSSQRVRTAATLGASQYLGSFIVSGNLVSPAGKSMPMPSKTWADFKLVTTSALLDLAFHPLVFPSSSTSVHLHPVTISAGGTGRRRCRVHTLANRYTLLQWRWAQRRQSTTQDATTTANGCIAPRTMHDWTAIDRHQILRSFWPSIIIAGIYCRSIAIDQRYTHQRRYSRSCLHATGHAVHWHTCSQQGTRDWPNDSGRLQTGLFGMALPLKLQMSGDSA